MTRHQQVAVLEAMAEDVVWNGEPIAGMRAEDAKFVEDIHSERD